MPENEFPPNSHSQREARQSRNAEPAPTRKEVSQVTRGKATLRKKPLHKKFLDAFRPEDNVGFVEYTLLEVLVPGIKDAVADAVHGTIDNALGSGGIHRRSRDRRGGGYTSYNRMSSARPRDRRDRDDDRDRRPARREARVADDVREVILPTRVECEEVIDSLVELASMYGFATMRDLMRLIGEVPNEIHEDWGWDEMPLRGSRIHHVGGGYLLDLPRPAYLD